MLEHAAGSEIRSPLATCPSHSSMHDSVDAAVAASAAGLHAPGRDLEPSAG